MPDLRRARLKEWLTAIMEWLGVYLVFSLVQYLWGRRGLLRRVAWGLNLAVFTGAVYYFLGDLLAGIHAYVALVFKAAFLFFTAIVVVRMTDWVFFEAVNRWRKARPIPVVLRDIGRWLVLAGLLFFIIRIVFPEVNLNVLAFSSLVVGYILANATQDTLGNLVAGLALNTETPFEIGDWVTVGGHTGRVVDMTWRATRLCTKNADHIIIPNSCISREPITNYSRPSPVHAQSFMIGASYEVPPKRVRDILQQTLGTVPEILADPPPRVYLTGYGDSAIQYRVKYYVTDFERIELTESDLMDLIWYAFRREGIGIPYPIREVHLHTTTAEDEERANGARRGEIGRILRGTDLFAALPEEELDRLASHFREALYARGECLVRQGEEGDSFFLVRSGRVAVAVREASGRESVVVHLESAVILARCPC